MSSFCQGILSKHLDIICCQKYKTMISVINHVRRRKLHNSNPITKANSPNLSKEIFKNKFQCALEFNNKYGLLICRRSSSQSQPLDDTQLAQYHSQCQYRTKCHWTMRLMSAYCSKNTSLVFVIPGYTFSFQKFMIQNLEVALLLGALCSHRKHNVSSQHPGLIVQSSP